MTTSFIDNSSRREMWLGWFLICMFLPFTLQFTMGFVRPYEIAILFGLLSAVIMGKSRGLVTITALDRLVLVYALYQVFVVVIGSLSFYESARSYRYQILVPVLTYAAIRLLPFSLRVVTRAHVLLGLVVLIQTLLVIAVFVQTGLRPTGMHETLGSIVKYSFLSSYIVALLIFSWRGLNSRFKQILALSVLLIIGIGILVSASRGVTLPVIFMLLFATWIWRSTRNRQLLAFGVAGGLFLLLMLIAFSPPKFEVEQSELLEQRSSLERIVSPQDYIRDLSDRIQFWALMFDTAMERPLFGYGASAYSLGDATDLSASSHQPAHSHNLLVSSILTGGIIGLVLMLGLVLALFSMLTRLSGKQGPGMALEKALLVWAVVFLVVALTQDLKGGVAVLFFFMLGLIQQLVLHRETEPVQSIVEVENKQLENDVGASNRILSKARSRSNILVTRKSP